MLRFRQRPADRAAVAFRQRGQVRGMSQVLQDQLASVGAVERPNADQQFLVDDGQAVLVAEPSRPAVERFRGGVHRRDAAGHRRARSLEQLDQPEVGDLDVVVDQEQVLRLDVQVLQVVLHVHHVEGFGGLGHVAEQLLARDAGQVLRAALAEPVPERAVGQLHDDEELAVDDVEAFQGQEERMADLLDAVEGLRSCSAPLPSSPASSRLP